MSDENAHDNPDLGDIMEPTEDAQPDRREHAKAAPRPDDDRLEERTNGERAQVGLTEEEPPA